MGRQQAAVLYALTRVVVAVGVDLLFFRDHFWARLMANVGIVLVFGAFYLRFSTTNDRALAHRPHGHPALKGGRARRGSAASSSPGPAA